MTIDHLGLDAHVILIRKRSAANAFINLYYIKLRIDCMCLFASFVAVERRKQKRRSYRNTAHSKELWDYTWGYR